MGVLRRVLVTIFGICLAITLSVLVLIYRWGLEPKSWWWIIGVGFFGQIVAQLIVKAGISDKD